MPTEIIVFFAGMIPFLELKLAIPIGLKSGLSIPNTLMFATAGTIVIPAITLALLEPVSNLMRKHSKGMNRFFENLFSKTRSAHSKNFNRYGALFLILLIAIPLPGSGANTAALVAFLFGVDYWRALGLIAFGAMVASIVLIAGFGSFFAIVNAIH